MQTYQCRNWTFTPDNQMLIYNDGREEHLPLRQSLCLATFLSEAGKTVSYDTLLMAVWGTTHKDASTISSVVSEVRKRIGCGIDGKKIIVTVPKRGYRFTEDVVVSNLTSHSEVITKTTEIKENETLNTQAQMAPPIRSAAPNTTPLHQTAKDNNQLKPHLQRKPWTKLIAIFGLITIVLFLTLGILPLSTTPNEKSTPVLRDYEVLTYENGKESEFDVSQDGLWLVYVNQSENAPASLVVKNIDSGKTQKIVATSNYYFGSPVFSRDAQKVVFHKQTKQKCEVWIADFSRQQLRASATQKLTDCGKGGFWSTLAFSKDGEHVYFSRAEQLTDPYKVYRLDLRTQFERRITSPSSTGRGDYSFAISPDGEQIAIVRNVLWQESHIMLNSTTSSESEPLFVLPYLISTVSWLNNEQLLYCDENKTLWSFNIENQTQKSIVHLDFSCDYPVASKESIFAIKTNRTKNAIWSLHPDTNNEFSMLPLISSSYYDYNAMFGPGESIYFMSDRTGEESLWQYSKGEYLQRKDIKLPTNAKALEYSVETDTIYGLANQRLFRYDFALKEVEWLSPQQHEVFNFSISDNEKLIFSEGKDEYWTLKSLDLLTLEIKDLNINGFSARQVGSELYYSKFHEKGLWRVNTKTNNSALVVKDIAIKFNTFWDIWDQKYLIWMNDGKVKVFDLSSGELINSQLTYQGHVGFLKCNKQREMCTFSFRERDESEVIFFKKEKINQ